MATSESFEKIEERLRFCVREERMKSGMTQAELARRGEGLKPSTVAKFESGQTPNVTLKSIYEMAKATSLPLSELIRRAELTEAPFKEISWDKVIKDVGQLSEDKKTWLANLIREALKGCV